MALPGPAKTLFDLSLRLSRTPVDVAMRVTGRTDSTLELTVDRLEAGVRSAAGVLFADQELREQGMRGRLATRERERAADLREDAAEEAAAAEERVEAEVAELRREDAERDAAATLRKAEATDAALDAEAESLAAEREAEVIDKAASKAKRARKKKTSTG